MAIIKGTPLTITFPARKTGLTFTAYVSKDGGRLSAATGKVTELTEGNYSFTASGQDTNAGSFFFYLVASDGRKFYSDTLYPDELSESPDGYKASDLISLVRTHLHRDPVNDFTLTDAQILSSLNRHRERIWRELDGANMAFPLEYNLEPGKRLYLVGSTTNNTPPLASPRADSVVAVTVKETDVDLDFRPLKRESMENVMRVYSDYPDDDDSPLAYFHAGASQFEIYPVKQTAFSGTIRFYTRIPCEALSYSSTADTVSQLYGILDETAAFAAAKELAVFLIEEDGMKSAIGLIDRMYQESYLSAKRFIWDQDGAPFYISPAVGQAFDEHSYRGGYGYRQRSY